MWTERFRVNVNYLEVSIDTELKPYTTEHEESVESTSSHTKAHVGMRTPRECGLCFRHSVVAMDATVVALDSNCCRCPW